jgi:hypothetical protein
MGIYVKTWAQKSTQRVRGRPGASRTRFTTRIGLFLAISIFMVLLADGFCSTCISGKILQQYIVDKDAKTIERTSCYYTTILLVSQPWFENNDNILPTINILIPFPRLRSELY